MVVAYSEDGTASGARAKREGHETGPANQIWRGAGVFCEWQKASAHGAHVVKTDSRASRLLRLLDVVGIVLREERELPEALLQPRHDLVREGLRTPSALHHPHWPLRPSTLCSIMVHSMAGMLDAVPRAGPGGCRRGSSARSTPSADSHRERWRSKRLKGRATPGGPMAMRMGMRRCWGGGGAQAAARAAMRLEPSHRR